MPALLAGAAPDSLICAMEEFAPRIPGRTADITFRVERLVPLFRELAGRGVAEVCFAGAVHRPALDPSAFDPATAALAPRFRQAMQGGDDATLRLVLALFEENGFRIRAAHELRPSLLPEPGVPGRVQPDTMAQADAARAAEVLRLTGPADIGQGCVVQQGRVLAVEALPGTDWMLAGLADSPFAARPDAGGGRGVFCKAAKARQDRRIDLPAIGPKTVERVAAAGLGGIVAEAGGVMVLALEEVVAACDREGLFLWVRDAG